MKLKLKVKLQVKELQLVTWTYPQVVLRSQRPRAQHWTGQW